MHWRKTLKQGDLMLRIKRKWLCGCVYLYAWENVNVETSLLKRSVSFSIVGLLWYFNVASLCVHIWKWLVKLPLAHSCCPPAEIGVGAQATWSLFVAVVNFSLFAVTTSPRVEPIHSSYEFVSGLCFCYIYINGVSRRKLTSLFICELFQELSVSSVSGECVKH